MKVLCPAFKPPRLFWLSRMARALALAFLLCLARADIDIDVEMLVPAEIGLNMSKFATNLRSWNPPVEETFNSTNTTSNSTNTTSTPPRAAGFFLPLNIRVAVAGLNNILCVTGFNLTQCYNDAPQPTPTPTPTPAPVAPPPSEPVSVYLILGVTLSVSFLLVAAALAILLSTKRRRAIPPGRAGWSERGQRRSRRGPDRAFPIQ